MNKTDKISYSKKIDSKWDAPKNPADNYWNWRVEEFVDSDAVFVDLVENVESWTGYQG